MATLGGAITKLVGERRAYSKPRESNWLIMGCDFQVDKDLKPWLLEVNACAGPPDGSPGNPATDPYPSMLRVMSTHFRRQILKQRVYHERVCDRSAGLSDQIMQVM